MRFQRARRLASQYRVPRAPGVEPDVQTLQSVDPLLQRRRQSLIGERTVGEQGLPLALRYRGDREEQGDVGWRPAIALVGVPPGPMRVLHRELAVRGERRVGQRRRLAADRRDVRHDEQLGHVRMHRRGERQRCAVILDLGAKQPAEADQQIRLVGDCVQAPDQQESAAFVERARQGLGIGLGRCYQGVRAAAGDEMGGAAKRRFRKRPLDLEPADIHVRLPNAFGSGCIDKANPGITSGVAKWDVE